MLGRVKMKDRQLLHSFVNMCYVELLNEMATIALKISAAKEGCDIIISGRTFNNWVYVYNVVLTPIRETNTRLA